MPLMLYNLTLSHPNHGDIILLMITYLFQMVSQTVKEH